MFPHISNKNGNVCETDRLFKLFQGNQVVGMSPGITNNANQALGMSPGISTHLGINGNNNGIPIQNLQNCDTNTLSKSQNSKVDSRIDIKVLV